MPESMRAIKEVTGMSMPEIEKLMDGHCFHGECLYPSGEFN